MASTCRILLVDDHDLVRRGIKVLIETKPGFEVCGEARTGREAVQKAQELHPDIVVMDVVMPELNGLDATRQILKVAPMSQVLIISQHDSGELMRQIENAGARGYIAKSDSERELIGAMEAISHHETFFRQRTTERPAEDTSYTSTPNTIRRELTGREREVIQLLAEGKSSKEVSAELHISTKTAETHRANIMRKLKLHSVSDLVRYAIRNNLSRA